MPTLRRTGTAAGLLFGAAAGLAGAGVVAALRRPLPRANGSLRLPGLHAPVQVLRDHWGVPHIYAQNNDDLFMAQGYVHAQDRLWQMEFQRRLGYGQLSELFGAQAIPADRFLRTLGFGRAARAQAQHLEEPAKSVIEAYVRGINYYLSRNRTRLPIEFGILRFKPRHWESADVLVWGKMMALSLCENWTTEILRAQLVAAVGPERAAQLDPRYPDTHPLALPRGVTYSTNFGKDALQGAIDIAPFAGNTDTAQGSNAWAVAGSRTASGKPLLANDPHVGIQMPSIWYENHLNGGDYHVTGASFPGSPGIIIGHNEWIAWGVTNGMTDVQDVYVERFDPGNPHRYEHNGAWREADVFQEEIVVRGQAEPVIEEVRVTRHGPVISSLVSGRTATRDQPYTEELALRWTALESGRIVNAVARINQARDWHSFRAALADWDTPAQNFVYADIEGHVGYALGGRLPIRAKGDGSLPVPGWNDEYDWQGTIPNDDLPHGLDLDEGQVVTANNQIADETYPYQIGAEWLSGYRAARIRELLGQTQQHSVDSFAHIQNDVRSLPGLELAALAGRLVVVTSVQQHARDALALWDGDITPNSIGATIYTRLREKLLDEAYAEVSGVLDTVTGLGAFASLPGIGLTARALPEVLARLVNREDDWLPGDETWDVVLQRAWEQTVAELQIEFGDDVGQWQYRRFHTLTIRHPLGAVPALASVFNRGPFPTGGDADTVAMGNLPRRTVAGPVYVGPSYRQICDLNDWDRSQSIHPAGQSGQPGSKHYADFTKHWLAGVYHPMLWSRMRVEEATASRLTLEP